MEYIASLSYGKDSIAMLELIHRNKLPLDRIVHVEIMATNDIPADLPEMMNYKQKADEIIFRRYGKIVEHLHAPKSYEDYFYSVCHGKNIKYSGKIYGFPMHKGNWCNSRLKVRVLEKVQKNAFSYIGIAEDEPNRFHNLTDKKGSPLVDFGWSEKQCYEWCEKNDLLSPIYLNSKRGGCWFCHNQTIESLRFLRKNYPQYWNLMLKWDNDSPVTFFGNGKTLHDIEARFDLEDRGVLEIERRFLWSSVKNPPLLLDRCYWQ